MHQPYASIVCDIDETEPDILSHAYDRVSEGGYRLQGGACAIWRKAPCIGSIPRSLAAAWVLPQGKETLQQCFRRPSLRP
jgi:hypothetical protein